MKYLLFLVSFCVLVGTHGMTQEQLIEQAKKSLYALSNPTSAQITKELDFLHEQAEQYELDELGVLKAVYNDCRGMCYGGISIASIAASLGSWLFYSYYQERLRIDANHAKITHLEPMLRMDPLGSIDYPGEYGRALGEIMSARIEIFNQERASIIKFMGATGAACLGILGLSNYLYLKWNGRYETYRMIQSCIRKRYFERRYNVSIDFPTSFITSFQALPA